MKKSKALAAGVALISLTGLVGCSTIAEPDQIGLYYNEGSSDGYRFDNCINPGTTGDAEWNNSVIYLPTSLRTWRVAPGEGADSKDAITVSTKPQDGQPSGVQVNLWSQTNFYLNTFCDANGGVVREFWEKIGRRYGADEGKGWRNMVLQTLVPALEKASRDVVRAYSADQLVGNIDGILAEVQNKISAQFTAELKRLAGGDFFCGPAFTRVSNECPAVELIITDVDFADGGIQEARNEKQKAQELAAAQLARAKGEAASLVAEAEGKAHAAAALAKLYANPSWVRLQAQVIAADALIKACEKAKECKIITGADGTILVQ